MNFRVREMLFRPVDSSFNIQNKNVKIMIFDSFHSIRYDFSDLVKFCKLLPNSVNFFQFWPNPAYFCQFLPTFVESYPLLPTVADLLN